MEGQHPVLKPRYFLHRGLSFDALHDQYPFVLPEYAAWRHLYYRGLTLYLRALLDDEAFARLPGEECSFAELVALPDRILRLVGGILFQTVRERAAGLAGREAYFWGYGAAWRHYRELFAEVKPRCFLVDLPGGQEMAEGVPVRHPGDMERDMANDGGLPVVLFVRRQHISGLEHALAKYPALAGREIIWAPLEG
jgi:hypothetical protein